MMHRFSFHGLRSLLSHAPLRQGIAVFLLLPLLGAVGATTAHAQAVVFSPQDGTVGCGETHFVDVNIDAATADLRGFTFTFQFDPAVVTPVSVTEGDLLLGGCSFFFRWVNQTTFTNTIEVDATGLGCSIAGPGSIIRIGFVPVDTGVSNLTMTEGILRDSNNDDILFTSPPDGSITSNCANIVPIAQDDDVSTAEDTALPINVLADNGNGVDSDADGTLDPTSVALVTLPSSGTAVNNGDGTVTYTPDLNFFGIDTFTYTVDDNLGATSNVATVTVTVTDVNDVPVAMYDNVTTFEDTPLLINVLADNGNGPDLDVDGTLVPSSVVIVTGPTNGSVVNKFNGTVNYTPNLNFNGIDTFTYTVDDDDGATSYEAIVTVTVTAVNDAPVVSDIPDQEIAEGGGFATISLDDFVEDVDNLDSEISWVATGNTEFTVDITARVATITPPDSEWNGAETITFTATDPGLLFNADAAMFTVTAVNDAPVVGDIPGEEIAEGDNFTQINLDDFVDDIDNPDSEINWSTSGNFNLSVDIDPVTHVATITPPSPEWNGSESIVFTATDPGLLSDGDGGIFTVTAVNDPPVVTGIPDQTVDEGNPFATIDLDQHVVDIDNLNTELIWTTSGNTELQVEIEIITRVATITPPDPNWNGSETITFTATDPGGLSDSDDAIFTVTGVNDPPTITDPGPQSGLELDLVSLQIEAEDIENDVLAYSALNLPPGLDIDSATGLISGTIDCGAPDSSPFSVEVTVDDGNGGVTQVFFTWAVGPLPLPTAIADLATVQLTSGNDSDGTTKIAVNWSGVPGNYTVAVYRKGFGNYPEYDDAGGSIPTVPATPTQANAEGWTLASGVTDSGDFDEPFDRDYWYYVAFVLNECSGVSPVSNLTSGALNYHLGDVSDAVTPGQGDNLVQTEDVSLLGAGYGVSEGDELYLNYLDVGPTINFAPNTRPTTDNVINFEDLMMFALNFQTVSRTVAPLQPSSHNQLTVYVAEEVFSDGTLKVHLWLEADGAIQGLSIPLIWDEDVVQPLDFTYGDLMSTQGGVYRLLSPAPGTLDVALFGVRQTAISGEGLLATLKFKVLRSGDTGIGFGDVLARSANNESVVLDSSVELGAPDHLNIPEVSILHPNYPNPFNPSTTVAFGVATEGRVTIKIYSIDGRLVRTLVDEARIPGTYREIWDGTSDRGTRVASGTYITRLVAPDRTQVHRMMLIK